MENIIMLQVYQVTLAILLTLGVISSGVAETSNNNFLPTSKNPHIPLDELDIIAAPLTLEELKIEADGWLVLVKDAAQKVAKAKIRIKHQHDQKLKATESVEKNAPHEHKHEDKTHAHNEIEKADTEKNKAIDDLNSLRAERTLLIDHLNIILERMNQKAGLDENGIEKPQVLVYRNYIDAVGGIKLDATDTESALLGIWGWLNSDEGGIRWAKNFSIFTVIIFIFWVLSKLLSKATKKALNISKIKSQLLSEFILGLVGRGVIFIGIIVGLAALEVNVGPLLAVIGAAGFVVAFALQDTLSNFASGIMIMLYRPFDVSDVLEVAGVSGKVQSMNLVSTTITSFDNKRMIIPNNQIWGNIITNATNTSERRIDMIFGIGYEDDIEKAESILKSIVAKHPLVLNDPEPVIQLHELADSSVNFICRPWSKTSDYWTVYWDVTRQVKERFDDNNVSIPFPQRDVHVYHQESDTAMLTNQSSV